MIRRENFTHIWGVFLVVILLCAGISATGERIDDHIDYYGYFINVATNQKYTRIPARYSLSSDPNVITVEIRRVHGHDDVPDNFHVELINVRYHQVYRHEYVVGDSPETFQPKTTQMFLSKVTRGREIVYTPAEPAEGSPTNPADKWVPQEGGSAERWVRIHPTERRSHLNIPMSGYYSWGPDFYLDNSWPQKPPTYDNLNREGYNFNRCFRIDAEFNEEERFVTFTYQIGNTFCTGNFTNPDPEVMGNAPSYYHYNEICQDVATLDVVRTRSKQSIRLIEDGSFEILVQEPHWTEYLYPCRHQNLMVGPLALTSLEGMTDDDDLYSGTAKALRRALTSFAGEPSSELNGLYSTGRCEMYSPLDSDKSVGFAPHELTVKWFTKPDEFNGTQGFPAGEFITKKGRNRFLVPPKQSGPDRHPDEILIYVNQCPSYAADPDGNDVDEDVAKRCNPRLPDPYETIQSLPSLAKIVFRRCTGLAPDALFGRFIRQDNMVLDYVLAAPTGQDGPYPSAPIRCERDGKTGEFSKCYTVLMDERKLVPRVSLSDSSIPENEKTFYRFTFTVTGALVVAKVPIAQFEVPRQDFIWDSREDFDRYVPLDQAQFILNGFFHQSLGHSFHDSRGSEVSAQVRGKRDVTAVAFLAGHRPQGLATMVIPEIHPTHPVQCAAIVARYPVTGQMSIVCLGVIPQHIAPNSADIREAYFIEPPSCPWQDKLDGSNLLFDVKSYAFDITPIDVTALDGLWRGPFAIPDEALAQFDDAAARRVVLDRPRMPIMESLSAPSSGNTLAYWAFVQAQSMLSLTDAGQVADISACRPFTVGSTTDDRKQFRADAPRYSYARDFAETNQIPSLATRQCTYSFNSWAGRGAVGDGAMECKAQGDTASETSTFFWSFPSGDRSLMVMREHISPSSGDSPRPSLLAASFPIANSNEVAKLSSAGQSHGGVTAIFVRCPSNPDPAADTNHVVMTEAEKQIHVAGSAQGNAANEGLSRPLAQTIDLHVDLSPSVLNTDRRVSSNSGADRQIETEGFAQYTPMRPTRANATGAPSPTLTSRPTWKAVPIVFDGILGAPRPDIDPWTGGARAGGNPFDLKIKFWDALARLSVNAQPTKMPSVTAQVLLRILRQQSATEEDEPLPSRPDGPTDVSVLNIEENVASGTFWINEGREAPEFPAREVGKDWRQPLLPGVVKADRHGFVTSYMYDYFGEAPQSAQHVGPLRATAFTGSIGTRVSVLTAVPNWSSSFATLEGFWAEIDPLTEKTPPDAKALRTRCKKYTVDQVPKFELYRWRLHQDNFVDYDVFSAYHPAGYGFSHINGKDTSMMYAPIGQGRMRVVRSLTGSDFPGTLRVVGQKGVSVKDYIPCENRLEVSFVHTSPLAELTAPKAQGTLLTRLAAAAGLNAGTHLVSAKFTQAKRATLTEPIPIQAEEVEDAHTEISLVFTAMAPSQSQTRIEEAQQKIKKFLEEDASFAPNVVPSSIVTRVNTDVIPSDDPSNDDSKGKSSSNTGLIIGLAVAGVIVLALAVGFYYRYYRRKQADQRNRERLLEDDDFAQSHLM